jgi:hypothetical protein
MASHFCLTFRPGLTEDDLKRLGAAVISFTTGVPPRFGAPAGVKNRLLSGQYLGEPEEARPLMLFIHDGTDRAEAKRLAHSHFSNALTGVGGAEAVAKIE